MTLPSLADGPNQVREYLSHVLVANHDASSTLAANIASKWQLGRFSDLRETSGTDFENIFGSEVGKLLFKSVQEDLANEFYASPTGIFNYWTTVLSVLLGVFFFVRAYYSSCAARREAALLRACLVLGPLMTFLAFQAWGCNGIFGVSRFIVGPCFTGFFLGLSLVFYGTQRYREVKGGLEMQEGTQKGG